MKVRQIDFNEFFKPKIVFKKKKETENKNNFMVACKIHGLFFWYDKKLNEGSCPLCKQDGIKGFNEIRHIKDSELAEDLRKNLENMITEKLENFRPPYRKKTSYYDSHGIWHIIEEDENMQVTESVKVEDGRYDGVIKEVNEITEPFNYIHFVIEFDIEETKMTFDYSCPANVTIDKITGNPTSKLAETLKNFNFEIKKDSDITVKDIESHFVGLKVNSLLQQKKSKKDESKIYIEVITMKPTKK